MDGSKKSFNADKMKFLHSILKRLINGNTRVDETAVDILQISAMLQILGFKLDKYENIGGNKEGSNSIKLELYCEKSGLKTVLSKPNATCACPSTQIIEEGKFWIVNGTSQDNINVISESHSSLLPTIPKETSMIVNDILQQLFAMICDENLNQHQEGASTSCTLKKVKSLEDVRKKPSTSLIRQQTWEVDPTVTSPPVKTSSPIPELCKSIDQISLSSDRDEMVVEILQHSIDYINKALILLPTRNNTFTKNSNGGTSCIKRLSNIQVSPLESPTRSTIGSTSSSSYVLKQRITPSSRSNALHTPTKRKAPVSGDKKNLSIQSKINSFRKKIGSASPNLEKKMDTPHPTTSRMMVAPKISVKKDEKKIPSAQKLSLLNVPSKEVSPNIPKKKTGIPSFGYKNTAGALNIKK